MYTLLLMTLLSSPVEPTLYVWHADWCGPCRQYAPIVAKLQEEGYDVWWIDYDKHRERAQEWEVRVLPTSILVTHDKERARYIGVVPYARMKEILERARKPEKRGTP